MKDRVIFEDSLDKSKFYKDLLKKYINHVRYNGYGSLIGEYYKDEFTEKEWEVLNEIDNG